MLLPPATTDSPEATATTTPATAAAFDSGHLVAFVVMRAAHSEVSDAVLKTAKYQAAGQGGPSSWGALGGGRYPYGRDSHYGAGGGDERQDVQQQAQHPQQHPWQGNVEGWLLWRLGGR